MLLQDVSFPLLIDGSCGLLCGHTEAKSVHTYLTCKINFYEWEVFCSWAINTTITAMKVLFSLFSNKKQRDSMFKS